jgi:hypothetical protein
MSEEDAVPGMDAIMSPEDAAMADAFRNARRHILSYFDRKSLVDQMRSIITESEVVMWASSRAEKFVDYSRPIFSLKIDRAKAEEGGYGEPLTLKRLPDKVEPEPDGPEDVQTRWVTNVMFHEVADRFTDFLSDSIEEAPELQARIKDILPEGIPESLLKKFILSTAFSIRVDYVTLALQFEYVF